MSVLERPVISSASHFILVPTLLLKRQSVPPHPGEWAVDQVIAVPTLPQEKFGSGMDKINESESSSWKFGTGLRDSNLCGYLS